MAKRKKRTHEASLATLIARQKADVLKTYGKLEYMRRYPDSDLAKHGDRVIKNSDRVDFLRSKGLI